MTHMAVPRATWVPAARTPSWRQYFLACPLHPFIRAPHLPFPSPLWGTVPGMFWLVPVLCLLLLPALADPWRAVPVTVPLSSSHSGPERLLASQTVSSARAAAPFKPLLPAHAPVTLPHRIHVCTPRCLPPMSTNPRKLSMNTVDHCIPWPLVSGNFHFP